MVNKHIEGITSNMCDTLFYYKYFRGKSLNKKFSGKSHFGGDNSHHDKNVIGIIVTNNLTIMPVGGDKSHHLLLRLY